MLRSSRYARPGKPGRGAEARQEEVVREYLKRAEEFDRKLGTPEGAEGPMTKEVKPYCPRVLVPAIGAFAEMSSDVDALADATASALAADHIQFLSTSAVEAKGVYKQRIWTAWGHAARREWARPLLDRRRDLIVHGPRATRSARGKFDEEEQQRHDNHHYHYPWHFHARAFD